MAAGVAVCILVTGIFTALPAIGQFTGSYVPEKISRGESANLFASWAGRAAVDGFVIQLPVHWDLEDVSILRNAIHSIPLSVRSFTDGRYEVSLANALESESELVLRIVGGDSYGSDRIIITPFLLSGASGRRQTLESDRISIDVHSEPANTDPENCVLSFAGSDVHPLILRPNAVPSLDLHVGFSASFWMKSTGLNQVVVSTWNGDENRGYPLEMIVGPSGRFRCFRGRPGRHQSMGSNVPIADGAWHHIVLYNEPNAGWMRLQIDGRTVDSLYSATPPNIDMELPLAIGGRVPGTDPYFDGLKPFSGFIDAIHIQHSPENVPNGVGPLKLDLDRGLPDDLLVEPARGVRLIPSDLSFRPAVDGFRAVVEGGVVLLEWHARGAPSEEFVIERSKDGHRFEAIDRVRAANPSGDYQYRDIGAGEGVAFYRLRQIFIEGGVRISGTIKIGLGEDPEIGLGEDPPERITIVGNFPNPFNNTTTISYVVNEQAHVRLSVWDVSGQSVRQLVDHTQGTGRYEVQFDAEDLPSGTYFVRLQSPEGTKSQKIILMK